MVAVVFQEGKAFSVLSLRLSFGSHTVLLLPKIVWSDQVMNVNSNAKDGKTVDLLKGGAAKSHCKRALPQGDKIHLGPLL